MRATSLAKTLSFLSLTGLMACNGIEFFGIGKQSTQSYRSPSTTEIGDARSNPNDDPNNDDIADDKTEEDTPSGEIGDATPCSVRSVSSPLVTDLTNAVRIRSVQDLSDLRNLRGAKDIVLCGDIDFNNSDFQMIPLLRGGKFDGRGYTIRNLKSQNGMAGIFLQVEQVEFANFKIQSSAISRNNTSQNSGSSVGLLATTAVKSSFRDIEVLDSTVAATMAAKVGSLIGTAMESEFTRIKFRNVKVLGSGRFMGILAGDAQTTNIKDVKIEDSLVDSFGNLTCYYEIGSFLGKSIAGTFENIEITSTTVKSRDSDHNVLGANCNDPVQGVGGFIGHLRASALKNSSLTVDIEAIDMGRGTTRVGGVAGQQGGGTINKINGTISLAAPDVLPSYQFSYKPVVCYNDSNTGVNTENTIEFRVNGRIYNPATTICSVP